MAGFSVQEPFFSKLLDSTVSTYLSALKDPALPLMEMQVREGGREEGREGRREERGREGGREGGERERGREERGREGGREGGERERGREGVVSCALNTVLIHKHQLRWRVHQFLPFLLFNFFLPGYQNNFYSLLNIHNHSRST